MSVQYPPNLTQVHFHLLTTVVLHVIVELETWQLLPSFNYSCVTCDCRARDMAVTCHSNNLVVRFPHSMSALF